MMEIDNSMDNLWMFHGSLTDDEWIDDQWIING